MFILGVLLIGCFNKKNIPSENIANKKIVAYVSDYSYKWTKGYSYDLSNVPAKKITDLILGFGVVGYNLTTINPYTDSRMTSGFTNNFKIYPTEPNDIGKNGNWEKVVALKQKNPNLKVLLSIGGFGFCAGQAPFPKTTIALFSQMISNDSNRKQFIASVLEICEKYHFDGIDIDWEYPGLSGGKKEYKNLKDFPNYLALCEEMSLVFKAHNLLLTMAISSMPKPNDVNQKSYQEWLKKFQIILIG